MFQISIKFISGQILRRNKQKMSMQIIWVLKSLTFDFRLWYLSKSENSLWNCCDLFWYSREITKVCFSSSKHVLQLISLLSKNHLWYIQLLFSFPFLYTTASGLVSAPLSCLRDKSVTQHWHHRLWSTTWFLPEGTIMQLHTQLSSKSWPCFSTHWNSIHSPLTELTVKDTRREGTKNEGQCRERRHRFPGSKFSVA